MTISYNLNIPNGPNNPSNDQPLMKTNTNSTSQLISIDHVTFNDATNPNGYHTVIHQTLQGSDPAAIVGINQIYSKNRTITNSGGSTTDTQLFTRTGLGGISQITGNNAGNNGYSFISGVILQWGVIAPTNAATVTVTFNTAPNFNFPNNLFNVQVTRQRPTASPGGSFVYYVDNTTLAKTGFNIINGDGHTYGYFWFAIGN